MNHILTCDSVNKFFFLDAENSFHCIVAEKHGTWYISLGTIYAVLQQLSIWYGLWMEREGGTQEHAYIILNACHH